MSQAAPARPADVDPRPIVVEVINRYKPVIGKLLARTDIGTETFVAQVANAFRATPNLWQCEPETVLGAALRCAQLAMPPNDGNNLCWIIPYGRNATFQLGYGGVMELARRAVPGMIFDGHAVYPGDDFSIDLGAEQPLTYKPAFSLTDTRGRRRSRQSREAYAWWVRARYPDGRVHVHALNRDDVEYHRAFSKQPNGDMWTKSYDAAALKTVVLDMRRWLPTSPQLAAAVVAEGSVVDVRDLDPEQGELPPGDSGEDALSDAQGAS